MRRVDPTGGGMPKHWLMKSEPDAYGWDDLVAEKEGTWDGVRSHQAKNNLLAMEVGDLAFFYHSNIGREIVGIVEVTASNILDPTDETGQWAAVKVIPRLQLPKPVSLKDAKANPMLADMELVRLSRLSVCKVTPKEWAIVTAMGGIENTAAKGS